MRSSYDIVIVGAGIAGLAATIFLAANDEKRRLRLTVVDAGSRPVPPRGDDVALRVSSIAAGSADMLQAVDAWPNDEHRVCPYDHMRVWDEDDSPDSASALVFDAGEFAVPHLGYIIENVVLQHALLQALAGTQAELRFDSPLQAITERGNSYSVTLDNGVSLDADLVIGADGARSRVRDSAGIDVTRHPYDQTAFVTHLQTTIPHRHTAWQRFLRDGPIGILPLADGRVSIVWSTSPDNARWANEAADDDLGRRLTEVSDGVLGDLGVAGARGVFPLVAQHADYYVRRGIALIGDAAHSIHPLAGQVANLGIADAARLSQVVHAALADGEHPADRPVLRRYERARKGENAAMMHFMTGLNRLFAADSDVLGELRKAGLALFNRSGPIRRTVVGVALGGKQR